VAHPLKPVPFPAVLSFLFTVALLALCAFTIAGMFVTSAQEIRPWVIHRTQTGDLCLFVLVQDGQARSLTAAPCQFGVLEPRDEN
jgi:hypothetical protein